MLGFGAIAEFAVAQIEPVIPGINASVTATTATASGSVSTFRQGAGVSDAVQAAEEREYLKIQKEKYLARLKAQRLRYEAKMALERAERELEAERIEAEKQALLAKQAEEIEMENEEAVFLLLVA